MSAEHQRHRPVSAAYRVVPRRSAAAAHLRDALHRHGAPLHARAAAVRRGADPGRRRGRPRRHHRHRWLQRAHRRLPHPAGRVARHLAAWASASSACSACGVQSDGLNVGRGGVAACPSRSLPLPEEYAQFGDTVRRALDELAEHYQHVEKKFDDAAWIGARLTELLPIALNDKQALLEIDDPIARLDALLSLVPVERRDDLAASRSYLADTTGMSAMPMTGIHASTIQPMNPSYSPMSHAAGDCGSGNRGFAHHVDHRHPPGMQPDAGGDVPGDCTHGTQQHSDGRETQERVEDAPLGPQTLSGLLRACRGRCRSRRRLGATRYLPATKCNAA